VYAAQAEIGSWREAWRNLNKLNQSVYFEAGGNGHSRSNSLWYISTRPNYNRTASRSFSPSPTPALRDGCERCELDVVSSQLVNQSIHKRCNRATDVVIILRMFTVIFSHSRQANSKGGIHLELAFRIDKFVSMTMPPFLSSVSYWAVVGPI
jgi:hypothetical protein